MVLIHTRKFLGCLALRAGVWILGLLSFMLGIAGAIIGWFEVVVVLTSHPLSLEDKVSLLVWTTILSLMVFLSIIGITVGITERIGLAFIYSKLITAHNVLLLVALAFTLVLTLRPVSDTIIDQCINGSSKHMVVEFCTPGWSLVQGVPVCIVGASFLVQTYAFVLSSNFAEQLDLEIAMIFPDTLRFTKYEFNPMGKRVSLV